LKDSDLSKTLTDSRLAQFGDSLLNFAYSTALTETTGRPTGTKVSDKILADAAGRAGLRKHLPKRVDRGEVANSLEALLAYVWLEKVISLEEIVGCLKTQDLDPAKKFSDLASLALSRVRHRS